MTLCRPVLARPLLPRTASVPVSECSLQMLAAKAYLDPVVSRIGVLAATAES